ncbi:DUF6283 family protein [Streptomyces sp. NPDC008079]|uniref:DUF6283 family protein n=1 Tax=Streptomyces sp. NPDC008079 TaxID=3364806 RepID=UPI0036E93F2F
MALLPPSRTPCGACPYRRDVPSGIWDETDYAKLPPYDRPTPEQPVRLFQCHLYDAEDSRGRICGGWAGCHDGNGLLALRVALIISREITPETERAIREYESPVPLFASGAEAAAHGMRELENPGPQARREIEKIQRIRTDLACEIPEGEF